MKRTLTPMRCIHCLHPASPTDSDPICTECGRRVRGPRSSMYAYIAPIITCTILVAGNIALLMSLGGKRNLEAVAISLIAGPGGNVLIGLLSLACIPLARRWLRPHSARPHVLASIVGPIVAIVVDMVYIRSLPFQH